MASDVFKGNGEISKLIRAKDWTTTSLGAVDTWSGSLRTVLRLMLSSRYAMWMGWGPDLIFFYNDAYAAQTLGTKHPWALGQPASAVWAEIWDQIGPRIAHVMQTGDATWDGGLQLFLERSGYPEETYHTFSYSPAPGDAAGESGGLFCVVIEETERVIADRRLSLLRDFAASLSQTKSAEGVFGALAQCLRKEARDLPFSLCYSFADDKSVQRMSFTGFAGSEPEAAPTFLLDRAEFWPLQQLFEHAPEIVIELDPTRAWPKGAWERAPSRALALPITQPGDHRPIGVFIAGLNPHRPLDDSLRSFITLFVGQLAAGLANAGGYEAAQKRAEALAQIDRAKTAFFSNVSHEFRTPLTLMLGPLEDALADPEQLAPKQRERLDVAHRNSLRLQRLVNSLLDFSRMEAGRVQAAFRPTDLASLTRDLASSFRAATDRAGLKLVVDTPSLMQPVWVDRDMWEKIVLNLMSNAFKFTLEGEIRVRLTETPDRVQLTVADTGIGIPAAELPKLFERFHRVEGASGRSYEGSGIGLALVSDLVGLHCGELRVESEPGRGTAFTIGLPLGFSHLPAEQIHEATDAAASGSRAASFVEEALRWIPGQDPGEADEVVRDVAPGADGGPAGAGAHHIVLADDNADLRDYIARLLRGRGHLVHTVPDGAAALSSIRNLKPDLLITDVMMPRLDGIGLLKAIRQDPVLQDLSVIVLSARSGEEARVEGLDAGADDYLVKPFSARELIARVDSYLAMTRLRRAATVALRDEARMLEALNRTGANLAGQLDLERVVQMV